MCRASMKPTVHTYESYTQALRKSQTNWTWVTRRRVRTDRIRNCGNGDVQSETILGTLINIVRGYTRQHISSLETVYRVFVIVSTVSSPPGCVQRYYGFSPSLIIIRRRMRPFANYTQNRLNLTSQEFAKEVTMNLITFHVHSRCKM